MLQPTPALQRLIVALEAIESAAADNAVRSVAVCERAAQIRHRISAGEPLVEVVEGEQAPRIVELLSANMATLETAGTELRVAEALALREHGLTIEAIASLFGVSRQRISALLRQRPAPASPPPEIE
jgi:hypothetical protein